MSHHRWIPILALLLSACTTNTWVKDGATSAQMEQDDIACQREASREASLRADGFYGPSRAYGYGAPGPGMVGPHGSRTMDQASLTDFCMRAKGYRREPVKN